MNKFVILRSDFSSLLHQDDKLLIYGNFEAANITANNYVGYPVLLEVGRRVVEQNNELLAMKEETNAKS